MIVVPFDRLGLKEPTWENVVVGEEFGPLTVVISDHAVKSHLYAVDAFHPWYLHDSTLGGRIAPGTPRKTHKNQRQDIYIEVAHRAVSRVTRQLNN